MKKIICLMVMVMVILIPINTFAVSIEPIANDSSCEALHDGKRRCYAGYSISEISVNKITFKLTEKGGADIDGASFFSNHPDWEIVSKSESNGVWTVVLKTIGDVLLNGKEEKVIGYTYTYTGGKDCEVIVDIDSIDSEVPNVPDTPNNPETPNHSCKIVDGKYYDNNGNEVTEEDYKVLCPDPNGGYPLPYIAVGIVAILAVGAYLATKNKAKMYKI